MSKRNHTNRDRARRILDTLDRDEITYHHVKSAWIDLYGVGYLPNNAFLGSCIRMHDDWIATGGLRSGIITYKRRATAASD